MYICPALRSVGHTPRTQPHPCHRKAKTTIKANSSEGVHPTQPPSPVTRTITTMSDQATIINSIICLASIFTSLRPQRCTALVTERRILSCRRYHIYRRVDVEGGPDSFFDNLCAPSGRRIVETRFEITKSSRPALPDMVGVDVCAWDLVRDMEKYLAKHMKKW